MILTAYILGTIYFPTNLLVSHHWEIQQPSRHEKIHLKSVNTDFALFTM
jgi:hypothetical protein